MTERKFAVVTGGSAGIGAAICQALLAADYDVASLDRQKPTWSHARLKSIDVDLMDAAATEQAATELAKTAPVSHLVHNAGIILPNLVEKAQPDDLVALTRLHLAAPLVLLKAFLPGFKARRAGRVILISSRAALGVVTRTAYSATKAGIIGMGRTWALELAQHGITVNMIAPGPIGTTQMFQKLVPVGSDVEGAIAKSIPIGRLGAPEDVANAVVFFAQPQSSFVTGQVLYVCGGASVGVSPV